MADNFDDIEVYQATQGEVSQRDPLFYSWLLRVISQLKTHFVNLQDQITNISLTPGPQGDPGTPGTPGIGTPGVKGDPGAKGDKGDVGKDASACVQITDIENSLYIIMNEPCGMIFTNGAP